MYLVKPFNYELIRHLLNEFCLQRNTSNVYHSVYKFDIIKECACMWRGDGGSNKKNVFILMKDINS